MAHIANVYKKRGEILVELGLITNEQLNYALSIQKTGKQKIEKILIELGIVTKEQITEAVSKKLNIPIIFCEDYKISDELKRLVPGDIAKKEIIFPIEKRDNILILAMADPLDVSTGPTGSGKTTTLYACLSHLQSGTKNIVTIEDPVEYKLEGITQIQVNEAIGRTFATVLRAVLRQDPDIIKIGEIRDIETAEIAIRASLTGHLVLTTLHTNNTVATITRLIDIGIPPYLINSAVSGVLAQRLVRRLCNNCKVESEVPGDLSSLIDYYGLPELTSCCRSTG